MQQKEDKSIYKVTSIGLKDIQIVNLANDKDLRNVPKYKLPLGLEIGMSVEINSFGLYEIVK